MTVSNREPAELVAGDTWAWRRTDLAVAYPASQGWALSYVLVAANAVIPVAATADGDAHMVNVPAVDTAGYVAGLYTWDAYVAKTPDRFRVGRGTVKILPNLQAAGLTGVDGRSHARRVLDAIEAVIECRAGKDQASYQIGDRRLDRTPIADLLKLRDSYRAEVARQRSAERLRQGKGTGRMVLTRFREGFRS